jgi:mannose-6-phosphate isomerase-like protein (cupin superfamily)
MKEFHINIEAETLANENFRKVLYTSAHSQLVLMSLKPKEEIGKEIHTENDQFFRIEKGDRSLCD